MTTVRTIQRYGYKPDLPDHRDLVFDQVVEATALPKAHDLSEHMPPIYDQGQLGSCTGNGWARVMEYMGISQGEATVTPSRLFIYYNERVIENTVDQDAGAEIRDGAKVVSSLGAPPETDWPYDINRYAAKPPQRAYDDGLRHEALAYKRINVSAPGAPMRSAIAQGYPIVFGFSVPDSFEDGSWDPASNPLPLPGPQNQIVGGHCVVISGYDFSRTRFAVPAFQCDNSWGADWGMGGRFWMDYRWFTPAQGLADDLWIVQRVS